MKDKTIHILKVIKDLLKDLIVHFPQHAKKTANITVVFSSFFLLLTFFMISRVVIFFKYIPLLGKLISKLDPFWNKFFDKPYKSILDKLEALRPFKVRRHYLIYIAYQNLKMRKSRSLITIFGMSVGVGIIVYLLSLGYGIEKLVIDQVASLEELQMVDVSSGESSTASLSKEAVKKMQKIKEVKQVIPMISVVGRLDYKNAKTDMLVYAVPKDYFIAANPEIVTGKYFTKTTDQDIFAQGQVAGESVSFEKGIYGEPQTHYNIYFSPLPGEVVPVWSECRIDADLLGFTTRTETEYTGMEYWGGEYAPSMPYGKSAYDSQRKKYLGDWIKGEVPMFQNKSDKEVVKVLDNTGVQLWKFGCIQRKFIQITQEIQIKGEVLSESTSSAALVATSGAELDEATPSSEFDDAVVATSSGGLEIISLEKTEKPQNVEKVLKFKGKVLGEAVVSSAVLNLLNIPRSKATNEGFKISFIIIKSLMPSVQGRILTEEVAYKIVGVVDDDDNQFIYIPIQDITMLGVTNFSQAKLLLNDQKFLAPVRKAIESMGYKTASTVDTVAQIESFFGGLRSVLGIIGFIALGVASLGMFNTLTVSLLERTREIGGMKTMGMVSGEIQELFLAEAMIMGFAGGIGGLLLGILGGQLSSYVVSLFAIAQGVGYLSLTHVPFSLILFIVISSFVVGVVTGLYPSHRAKKISALNALRYE